MIIYSKKDITPEYDGYKLDEENLSDDDVDDQLRGYHAFEETPFPSFLEPGDMLHKPVIQRFSGIEHETRFLVLNKPIRYKLDRESPILDKFIWMAKLYDMIKNSIVVVEMHAGILDHFDVYRNGTRIIKNS